MVLQLTGTNINGSPELSLSGGNSTTFMWSPFGGVATRTGNAASLPGFNGERQDPLSGVTHLGNGYRAYSPALRRFTCPDSESPFGGGGVNPYVYCDHDPVNNTDPSGHMPKRFVSSSAMMKAARRQQMEAKIARNRPVGLPPLPEEEGQASTSSAAQKSSGVPYSSRTMQTNPASPVPGVTTEEITDYAMAPAYMWAVSNKQIQNASEQILNINITKKIISKYTLDKNYLQKNKIMVNYAFNIYKKHTEAFIARKLDDLIDSLGTIKNKYFFRGMPKQFIGKPGEIIQENRFTAVSSDFAVAQRFAGHPSYGEVIEVTGGRTLNIPNIFQHPGGDESEYLYARNTKFKVSQDLKTGRIRYTAMNAR